MIEFQKRQSLIKLIRVQWIIILCLTIAFVISTICACSDDPIEASHVWPTGTLEPSSVQTIATSLVSISESTTATIETPELICMGEYKLTAYCPCVKCCGIWSAEHSSRQNTGYIQKTASGSIPKEGRTVAVDTSIIPFGTVIIIDGHEYVAEDRGGAVKENVIDIFFENHQDAVNFGVQYKTIYIKGDSNHD